MTLPRIFEAPAYGHMNSMNFILLGVGLFFTVFSSFSRATGLENSGNLCFANSVFQLLHQSKDFRAALEKSSDSRAQALNRLFLQMDSGRDHLNPKSAIPENLRDGFEHDAEELLLVIRSINDLDLDEFKISDDKYELELNIPAGSRPKSLNSLLEAEASELLHHPSSLLINLKRGRYVDSEAKREKYIKPIEAPLTLSIPPDTKYRLKAFIKHLGSGPDHGHFLTYYCEKEKSWMKADDEQVQPVTQKQALQHAKNGYIYLYERQ